jgi:hypothetical protein
MDVHSLDIAPFWSRLVLGLLGGAATWLIAADYGTSIVSRWLDARDRFVNLGVGAALGYSLLGSIVALLGLVHAVLPATMYALLAVAIVARAPVWLQKYRSRPRGRLPQTTVSGVDWLALGVIAVATITGVVAAALPAVWWDPIAYHLPLAASALARGAFAFTPHMVQSGFPQLGEAAALPAYALAGSAGAAMATLGCGLCLCLLAGILASRFAPGSGILTAMLVATCPLWLWLAPSFYVDVPFATFAVAGIVASIEGARGRDTTIFIAAGWLCGAAAAVKYSGLGVCAILLAFALVIGRKQRWRIAGYFLLGAAIVAGGWYVRSYLLTGDVLYPFLFARGAGGSDLTLFASRYAQMTRDWCSPGRSPGDLLTFPYRLFVSPRQFCGDPGIALRAGIVFAIAALIFIRPALTIATITIALTLAWFYESQQWRFGIAPVSTYAALVASGTGVLGVRLRSFFAAALCVLGAFTIALNWLSSTRTAASQSIAPAFSYMAGRQSAEQYLDDRLETFAAARWLRQQGIPGNQILALDDVRDYYFPAGTLWGNPFYQPAISIDWQAAPTVRYARLRTLGISYLVVNANPAYVARTPTGVDWATLANDAHVFVHQVFARNGVIVYKIVAPS